MPPLAYLGSSLALRPRAINSNGGNRVDVYVVAGKIGGGGLCPQY